MIAYNNKVHFNPDDFPLVVSEIDFLSLSLRGINSNYKSDIVISYLKDHSIKSTWARANPRVTELLTLTTFPISHIEAIFVSCRQNFNFLNEFEKYFRDRLSLTE